MQQLPALTDVLFYLSHVRQENKTQDPGVCGCRDEACLTLPAPPPTKSNLLYYCGEIVSFNLLINCWIVLWRKRLASTASLQRSHLQPVHSRTCARSQQTHTRVLTEKDRCRYSASVKGPMCKDIESSSFNIRTRSTVVYLLPLMK